MAITQGYFLFVILGFEKSVKLTALFLGWPTATGLAQRHFVFGGFGFWRIPVGIKRLGFGRRAAPCAQSQRLDHPDMVVQVEHQYIANPQGRTGPALLDAIDPQMTIADKMRRQSAGFEKPRMPQPFIGPHVRRRRIGFGRLAHAIGLLIGLFGAICAQGEGFQNRKRRVGVGLFFRFLGALRSGSFFAAR